MDYADVFTKWEDLYDEEGNQLIDNSLLFPIPEEMEEEPLLLSSAHASNLLSFAERQENKDEKITLNLLVPRKYQRTIAPGRDFYVTGEIKVPAGQSIPTNALFRVQLKEKRTGRTVREVWSCNKDDRSSIFAEGNNELYLFSKRTLITDPAITAKVAKDSCMPELIYCPVYDDSTASGRPESLKWTWNKAYYTDTFFSALIYSGGYEDKDHIYQKTLKIPEKDEDRVYPFYKRHYEQILDGSLDALSFIQPLAQGDYELCVSIHRTRMDMNTQIKAPFYRIDGEPIVSNYVEIKIGYQNSTALTVFGDNDHLKRLFEMEKRGGATLIWDPLPGNWERDRINSKDGTMREPQQDVGEGSFSAGNGLQLVTNSKRTIFCDISEYRAGSIVFYDYKIQAWSYALLIELPEVVKCADKISSLKTYRYKMDSAHYGEFIEMTKGFYFTKLTVKEMKNGIYEEWADFDYEGKEALEFEIDPYMWNEGLEVLLTGVCSLPDDVQLGVPNERGEYHNVERYFEDYYTVFPKGEVVKREIGTQKFFPDSFVRLLEFEHCFKFNKNTLAFHDSVLIWPNKVVTTIGNEKNPVRPRIALRKKE